VQETLLRNPPEVLAGKETGVAVQALPVQWKARGLPCPPLAVAFSPTARQSVGLEQFTSSRTSNGEVAAGVTPAG